ISPPPRYLASDRHLDRHVVVTYSLVEANYDLGMHIWTHRHGRTEHRSVELAAGGEDGLANDFGIEALDRFAPIQAVFRIAPVAPRIAAGGLAVGGGGHDDFVQPLQLPAVLDKIAREPIKQFGMGRPLTHEAEVR